MYLFIHLFMLYSTHKYTHVAAWEVKYSGVVMVCRLIPIQPKVSYKRKKLRKNYMKVYIIMKCS